MSHKSICGVTPVGASSGFNLYSPTFVRGLRKDELPAMAKAYGRSVNLAREAGFDAVEIHAGHGYLISQFLRLRPIIAKMNLAVLWKTACALWIW